LGAYLADWGEPSQPPFFFLGGAFFVQNMQLTLLWSWHWSLRSICPYWTTLFRLCISRQCV